MEKKENTNNSGIGANNFSNRFEQLKKELELIKRIHLKAIINLGKNDTSNRLDESALKQIGSFLKVLEKELKVLEYEDRLKSSKEWVPVELVWEILLEIPKLEKILKDPKIKRTMIRKLKERIKKLREKEIEEKEKSSQEPFNHNYNCNSG